MNKSEIKEHIGSDLRDTAKIHMYPHMLCQQKCSYCYVRNSPDVFEWGKSLPKDKMIEIMTALSEVGLDTYFILLGGEPTTYAYFLDMIHLWKKLFNKSHKSTFEVTTNGMATNVFRKLSYIENTRFCFSYHAEEADPNTFIDNLYYVDDLGIRTVVNAVIVEDSGLWSKIEDVRRRTISRGIEFRPTLLDKIIYSKKQRNIKYDTFLKEMIYDNRNVVRVKTKNGTIQDIPIQDYYRFGGQHDLTKTLCISNAIDVDPCGNILDSCTKNILTSSNYLDFFKKSIIKNNVRICKNKTCSCSEFLIDFKKIIYS